AYGSRGIGIPAQIARKMQKKNQTVILYDPERQYIRREGEVPVADFIWYSAARPCTSNCFDCAKIARVMNAAGRRRDALPQGGMPKPFHRDIKLPKDDMSSEKRGKEERDRREAKNFE
ncbi:hypothetical protein Tco_0048122, partial [Tanacetum coccineum]